MAAKLGDKDFEIKKMQDRVKEAAIMKEEQKKCKARIQEVEEEFGLKERSLMDKLKKDMNQLI